MPTQLAIDHGLTGLLISAAAAYLLGSIPFGLIVTRMAGLGDIRTVGSGNIGATNVLRAGGKGLGAITLLLDAGKGAAAVLLAGYLFYAIGVDIESAIAAAGGDVALADISISISAAIVAALFAVLGHMFPVWLGFRGGKGVATALGCYLALSPLVGLASLVVWLLGALISRYSSVGSLLTLLVAPFLFYLLGPDIAAPMAVVVMVLGWIRHASNIRRLIRGEESRIRLGSGDRS